MLLSSFVSLSLINVYLFNIIEYESLIEILQVSILIFNLFILSKNKFLIKKFFGKFSLFIRYICICFLLIEELSYLTKNICRFCENFNRNGEFNLHNSFLFEGASQSILKLPIVGNISNSTLLISIFLVTISFGNYSSFLRKRIRGIFLEKKLAIFGIAYIWERIFYWVIIFSGSINNNLIYIIHNELIELFTYSLLTFDLIYKIKFIKEKKKKF